MYKKILCLSISVILIASSFCGCNIIAKKIEMLPFDTKESIVPSGIVAEKGDYALEWDAERYSLAILKNGEAVWASMPLDQYNNNSQGGAVKKYIESHIAVDYKDATTNTITSVISYIGALENGRIYSYLVEDGIKILYCFDQQCFAIPIIYRLNDGYLDISIDNENIYESGNEVYEISIMPYACGVENISDNRIFVPDGSGMIMNCDLDRPTREYKANVYGQDLAETTDYKFIYEENIHLPVFAISTPKYGTYSMIITEGTSSAAISASAGDSIIGYSYAYASFKMRGAETVKIPQGWGTVSISSQYSDLASSAKMQMRIYYMDEYDKNFINVANHYRNYLIDEKGLKETTDESILYYNVPMALHQKEFIFGIPRNVVKPVTNYEQAKNIIEATVEKTGYSPVVRLNGIQGGGLEVTKVAGGFKLESTLGNSKSLNSLLNSAQENGTKLYPNFDIARYSKSGSGFSLRNDSAKSSTSMNATQKFYSVSTGTVADNSYNYYLLSPQKFNSASTKLLNLLEKHSFNSVSLTMLGNRIYSDYSYEAGYIGVDYIKQVQAISKSYKNNKVDIMYESAFDYAAVDATCIIHSPTSSSNYDAQDTWIPFYQIVFKGYVPMSTNSLNLVDDTRKEYLRALQTGIGVTFTVCGEETSDYATSLFEELSAGSFENSSDFIFSTIKEFSSVFEKTKNKKIVGFDILSQGVYVTDFENGVKIAVNYNNYEYNDGDLIIKPLNFKVLGGE